jgi:CubicO group peptidase (beta-lactamase class C family)
MSFGPAPALAAFLSAASVSSNAPAATDSDPAVERHIEHVVNDIPPALIIDGQPASFTTLSARMATLHVPGVSIAVIHKGTLEWARGFGVAKASGSPVTPNTLFQAASISKPITALAILRLVDAGKLNLDTDVSEYLKSWKIPDNQFTAKSRITLRELLSHTAGITVPGFGGYLSGEPLPTLLQTLNGELPANNPPIRVDTVPHSVWRYAGGGYVILRQILEDVTGLPFAELLRDTVLSPMGMTHSTFQQPLSDPALARAAVPHDREGRVVSTGPRVYPELAPDGLWSTPTDLARYVIAVQGSLAGKNGSLLSPSAARAMLTAQLNPYGLGVIVGDDKENPWFTHNGGNYGYPCLFVAYNKGDGAAIMTDGANGFELGIDILRSIAQEYNWPDFKPIRHYVAVIEAKTLARYVGVYQLSPDSFAAIVEDGKGLIFQSTDQGRQPIFPLSSSEFILQEASPNPFFNRDEETRIRFMTDERGQAAELTLLGAGGAVVSGKKVAEPQAGLILAEMAAINHRFQNQLPATDGERLLRRLIVDISAGRLDDDILTADLDVELKSLRALNQQVFSGLGPVISMSFMRAAATGIDTYHIEFKNGHGEMDIRLRDDGKLRSVRYYAN